MIPGGVTEQVAREGGDALVGARSALLAGHPMNQVVYALTCSLGQVVMVAAETPAEAETLAATIAGDAANVALLNWGPRRDAARAAMAVLSSNPGARGRQ